MKKIRVAVIGIGYQGKFYVEKLAGHPKVELIGVSDTNPFRGKQISQQFSVSYQQDYREFFGKVDAVCVAVPVTVHFPIVREFLDRGVDVFVEKSLTADVHEGEELVRLADKNKLILQVGHSERFNVAAQLMRQKINAPSYMEAYRLVKFSGRGCDVDVITDLMVHDIDIILNLMGEDHPEIHAIGTPVVTPHIDIADVHMVFDNGCEVHLKASRVSSTAERSFKVFEPNRCLVADYLEQDLTMYEKSGNEIRMERFSTERRDILDYQIRYFMESVEKRIPPLINGEEGLAALRVVQSIRKSLNPPPSKENYLYGDTLRRSEKTI